MPTKGFKDEVLTIPNLLSFFRLLLIPVYMTIYLNANSTADYIMAGSILAVSCLTDMADGKIARKFNMMSTLGKILDPIADKVTQISLIVCLAQTHKILWSLVVLFIIKEGFQLIAGGINLKKRKILKGALISGKICTTIVFTSLIVLVVFPNLNSIVVSAITITDAIFMIIALIDYVTAYQSRDEEFQSLNISNPHKEIPEQ